MPCSRAFQMGLVARAAALALAACIASGCETGAIGPTDGRVLLEMPVTQGSAIDPDKVEIEKRSVELHPSNSLLVRLGAYGGTGYVWELAGPAPAVLNAEGLPKVEASSDAAPGAVPGAVPSAPPGAAQWTAFEFVAISQGKGTVRFVLRRPWEPADQWVRRVDVSVKVTPDPDKPAGAAAVGASTANAK